MSFGTLIFLNSYDSWFITLVRIVKSFFEKKRIKEIGRLVPRYLDQSAAFLTFWWYH